MLFRIAATLLLLVVNVSPVIANNQKSIEIVVPYAPGGASDNIGRLVARIFTDHGYQATVLNKPGASTIIGSNYVAATASSNTVLVTSIPSLTSNIVFKPESIKYTQDSFKPVVSLGKTGIVLVASNSVPVDNYSNFVKYVKENPTKFNVGVWSLNTASLVYEWAEQAQLPKPNIILYKGSAPMINDVVGNQLQFAFDTVLFNVPFINDNRLKAIVAFDQGSVNLIKKNMPNSKVVGIATQSPQLEINEWYYTLLTPSNASADTIKEFNSIINSGLSQPKYQELFDAMRLQNYGGSHEFISKVMDTNLKRFRSIKKHANIN